MILIKIRLKLNVKILFFERAILEMLFWGSNFENVFFKEAIFKMSFLGEQFW